MKNENAALGSVVREGDRVGPRYERKLEHPPERVWRAITESAHLRHWLPCDLVGERRGGAVLVARLAHQLGPLSLLGAWHGELERRAR